MPDQDESSPGESSPPCSSRRALLGGLVAGGLALSLQQVLEADEPQANEPLQIVLSFREHRELSRVGGSQVIESPRGKLIVARVDESSFVALSAICTHKGCEVEYRANAKEFVCPCHGARYGLDGLVRRGPAKKPLAQFNAEAALVLRSRPQGQ